MQNIGNCLKAFWVTSFKIQAYFKCVITRSDHIKIMTLQKTCILYSKILKPKDYVFTLNDPTKYAYFGFILMLTIKFHTT